MAGAIGGLLIASVVGHVLQWTGSYMIPFVIAGSAYLVALAMIQLLSPGWSRPKSIEKTNVNLKALRIILQLGARLG